MKRKSVLSLLFISYIAVWLVPFVLGICSYFLSADILKEKIYEKNVLTLSNVSAEIEFFFERQITCVDNILKAPLFTEISAMTQMEFNNNRYKTRSLMKYMNSQMIELGSVCNVSIILPQIDTVISSWGISTNELYYNSLFSDIDLDENEIKKIFRQQHKGDYYRINRNSNFGDMYMYITTIGSDINTGMPKQIVIYMDEKKFTDEFIIKNISDTACFIVGDSNNNILFSNGNSELCKSVYNKSKQTDKIIFSNRFSNREYQIAKIKNDISKREYIYALDKSDYFSDYNKLQNVMIIVITLSILLGIVLIFCFVRRGYLPIKRIVKIFTDEKFIGRNEYDLVEEKIKQIRDECKYSERKIETQRKKLHQFQIYQILHGESMEGAERFRYDKFILVYALIGDCLDIYGNDNLSDKEKQADAVFIVSNIMSELFGEFADVYSLEYDNMIGFVLNLDSEETEAYESYKRQISIGHKIINEEYNCSFQLLCSDMTTGCSALPLAYEQICKMMNYIEVFNIANEDIFYKDIDNGTTLNIINYPFVLEKQLIYTISVGDENKSMDLVKLLFKTTFDSDGLSIEAIQSFKCCIVATMMRILSNVKDGSAHMDSIKDIKERLLLMMNINKPNEIYEMLSVLVKDFCAVKREDNKQPRDVTLNVEKIIDYIDTNYFDVNLNISQIARHFGLHPDYITRIFKKDKGILISDYINETRIKKAKNYLRSTNMKISEIAVAVGIENLQTFNRIFKKNVGITPGNYRKFEEELL